jgi:ribosome-associated protein
MERDQSPPEISRTRKKKHSHEVQKIGEQLVRLNPAQLERLDLPEELREALTQARSITRHGARRRQMQYIGRLMLQVDAEQLAVALEALENQRSSPPGGISPSSSPAKP